eukprot:scaffold18792_cov135-Isochrysis_galbana.AAC.2
MHGICRLPECSPKPDLTDPSNFRQQCNPLGSRSRPAPAARLPSRSRNIAIATLLSSISRLQLGRKRYSLAATRDTAGHPCPLAVRTLPVPSPILSPSRFPCSGRYMRGMASELRALQQPGLEY